MLQELLTVDHLAKLLIVISGLFAVVLAFVVWAVGRDARHQRRTSCRVVWVGDDPNTDERDRQFEIVVSAPHQLEQEPANG
ncbi:MAG: hypothetical protein GY906_11470 [bacterium]|nr:hypothetical protein [bacterium]